MARPARGEVRLDFGGVAVAHLPAWDRRGRIVVEVDARDVDGHVRERVLCAELCDVDVKEFEGADEVGGGFGGVRAEEGEAGASAEELGQEAVALPVGEEGGGPVEVPFCAWVGRGVCAGGRGRGDAGAADGAPCSGRT